MSNLTQTKTQQINHKSKYDPKIISIDETPTPQPSPQQEQSQKINPGPSPKRLKQGAVQVSEDKSFIRRTSLKRPRVLRTLQNTIDD